MHIRKYDFDYSRRLFMEKTAMGLGGAGVLSALWPEVCRSGSLEKVYPDELHDIEAFTKGQVKVGDVIDADSIDLIQDLVDPILYQEVKQDGRKFFIQPSPKEIDTLYPPYFLDATIRNQGLATFDDIGNVYTSEGKPWIGGLPFPDCRTGNEAIANITLSWGRHDGALYAFPALVIGSEGEVRLRIRFRVGRTAVHRPRSSQCGGTLPVRVRRQDAPADDLVHAHKRRQGLRLLEHLEL